MNKVLIAIVVLAILGLGYYFLVVKNKSEEEGELPPTTKKCPDGSTVPIEQVCPKPVGGNLISVQLPFQIGDNVYLNMNAPAPGAGYTTNDTVVYSYPSGAGAYVIGNLHRDWYAGQPIGTFLEQTTTGWTKVRMPSLQVYSYNASTGTYGGIVKSGQRDVFFNSQFLSKTPY